MNANDDQVVTSFAKKAYLSIGILEERLRMALRLCYNSHRLIYYFYVY